jgi:5-methylcytosine-specific restriction endonuclease McrA
MTVSLQSKVLVVNKHRRAIDETTIYEALCDMCSGKACGIDMDTLAPVPWEEWLKLPIREGDQSIKSLHGLVRVPTVVGKFSYDRMHKRKLKNDNRGIAMRDGRVCQYTGRFAPDGNVDHVIPRSRRGSDSWENKVWSCKDINSRKGNKTPEEAGLKLLRKPKAPAEIDACLLIPAKHPDWKYFLPSKAKN